MGALEWQAWYTVAVVVCMFLALIREAGPPEAIMFCVLVALLSGGVLTPEQAFAGIANQGVLTIGAFFVLSAAIQKTGALQFMEGWIFPRTPAVRRANARLMLFTATISAFVNNTPLVAMLMPRVQAWCDRMKVAPSALMIPLSYAAILGGMTTLVGTSTNLLVSGLMESAGFQPMGMLDITVVGLPAAGAALAYFMLAGHRLLPRHIMASGRSAEDLRHTLFELRVRYGSVMAGTTVEQFGLRSLGGAFLVHIQRGKEIVPSAPEHQVLPGDVLSFSGDASALEKLRSLADLEPALGKPESQALPLYEAIVAPSSRLIGKTLKEVGFRREYDGVVIGIHRRDEQIRGPLGQTSIRPGDLLIIEAPPGFDQRWSGRSEEFFLVAPYRGSPAPVRHEKAAIALGTLAAVVATSALGFLPLVSAAFAGTLVVVAAGCITMRDARHAVNMRLLGVIAASLAVGQAIEVTGLAETAAGWLNAKVAHFGPVAMVAAVYLTTVLLTEVLSNNAAAALMLSIGIAAARHVGIPAEAMAITIAVAASASFLTPIGYQTNLMVMSAGGYRFTDFVRAGWPVSLIVGVVAVTMVWVVWL